MKYILDQDEVNALIAASFEPYEYPPTEITPIVSTYTEGETAALMELRYYPKKPKKKK
jgi:hypothetical protein